jgi:CheY-like chemotaxis protein
MALASVYGLVRRHGGGLFVDTAVGKGTRFSILLPAAVSLDPGGGKGTPANDGARHLVIVVDDEPQVGRGIARMIERRGIRAIACTDAQSALEALARAPVGKTLLLCDVVMPDTDGVEVAEEARRRVPGLPVLLMSGYTGGIDVTKSGLPLIDKPFDADLVVEQLLSLLPPPSGTIPE